MIPFTAEVCRQRRKAAGITQKTLSQRAGLSETYVWRFESGDIPQPKYVTLFEVESALVELEKEFAQKAQALETKMAVGQ